MAYFKKNAGDSETEAGTVKKMICDVKNNDPFRQKYPTYNDLIDFVVAHPHYVLDREDIKFLITYAVPPLGQGRDDFFAVFDTVLTAAKQTQDADLINEVYQRGLVFYENHAHNAQKTALVREGIDWFLLHDAPNYAGELYLKLTWAYANIGDRLQDCRKALRYLDRFSEPYACALASEAFMCEMDHHAHRNIIHYAAYGQKLISKDGAILLAPLTFSYWNSPTQSVPAMLCFHLPILKGYSSCMDPFGYWNMNKLLFDGSLAVGEAYDWQNTRVEDAVIHMQDGTEYQCRVFVRKREEQVVACYFTENVGLVRVVLRDDSDSVKATYQFDLCEYSIVGGEGFFPLAVGNCWSYRQINGLDTISQIISRKIVSRDGDEYILSGLDYIAGK